MTATALALLARRLLTALPIMLIVAALVFTVLRLLPADPLGMSLPPNASQADVAAMRAEMGFDRPIAAQFAIWLRHLAEGDLGTSIHFRRRVVTMILTALPTTLELVAAGLVLGIALGIVCGMAMFAWRGTLREQLVELGSTLVMSVPEFLWAILLILGIGVGLGLLPFIGRIDPQVTVPATTGFLLVDSLIALRPAAFLSVLAHLALPALALALALAPLIMRVLRSSLIDTYLEDYITLARLRGIGERRILWRHALKNAALPTLSLIGVQAGFMFGGTLLVEVIYAYPGLGSLMVDAVRNHDLPLIQGIALTDCVIVLAVNTSVDILYLVLNPKLRKQ
ncbi:MAG TPA: ABC transporter permease [Stellaceae bacterium]|nr:ABC transporter permease [Stellaceae bacterium]